MSGLPALDRSLIHTRAASANVALPAAHQLELPERAIQFGTGGFLRGFLDDLLDEANRRGHFGGRVVMVGSTGSGRDRRLNDQDGLFTLVVQGLVAGEPRRDMRVVASVSRALAAPTEWDEVLRCAESPTLEFIFSNTTEVGIAFDDEDAAAGADAAPHRSFPAKLAQLLLHRARHFAFDRARAPMVIPCELVEDNGDRLRTVVRTLAEHWAVERDFLRWLEDVPFCNTLVDRIVQGAPTAEQAGPIFAALGYADSMVTVCEPYRLFAIAAPERLRARLQFATDNPGVVLTDDVAPYRERKIRLLNGAHTALVSLALLAGCITVGEAVAHPLLGSFVRAVLFDEIVPSVPVPGAGAFAREVLERFANPFVQHALWDITLQGGTKLRVRLVPIIGACAQRTGRAPGGLALGFAAYLALQRRAPHASRAAVPRPRPVDAVGDTIHERWAGVSDDPQAIGAFVQAVAADDALWGRDLTLLPGFTDGVTDQLVRLVHDGAEAALSSYLSVTA
jgi:tagaturonate reductase